MDTKEFIEKYGIEMNARWIDQRSDDTEWHNGASHWYIMLSRPNKAMSLEYSMGAAHTGEPNIDDVLDCLGYDISTVENTTSFDEFCNELGYDTDSIKALNTWNAIQKQASKLHTFLGDGAIVLAYQVERL